MLRRTAALNIFRPVARAYVDGQPARISHVCARPGKAPFSEAGVVLSRTGDTVTIQVADGAVEVTAEPLGMPEMNSLPFRPITR